MLVLCYKSRCAMQQVLVHGQGYKTDRLLRGLARYRVGGVLLMAIRVLGFPCGRNSSSTLVKYQQRFKMLHGYR